MTETTGRRPQAILVKAQAIARQLGHADGQTYREYADWHIEIRAGTTYVTVWYSAAMVFLSLSGIPVYYRAGPWEQYLDRLFQKTAG